jgi:hypothetical protein
MSRFSASEAAISGLRFIRRRPGVVLTWAGVFFLCQLSVVLINLSGQRIAAVQAFAELNRNHPEAALEMLPSVAPIFLFTSAVMLGVASVTFAAGYRAILRPEHDRWAYLRLGKDELWMALLIFVWVVIAFGYAIVVAFFAGMLSAIGRILPWPLSWLDQLAVFIAVPCAFIVPGVRLSLSMPMTMQDHHLRLFESWKPTRGYFWSLLGAYFLALVFIVIIMIAEWMLASFVALLLIFGAGLTMEDLSGLWNPDTGSFTAYFRITTIIATVLWSLFFAVALAIFCAPVAQAYRALIESEDEQAAEAMA